MDVFCIDFNPGCDVPEPTPDLDSANFSATVSFLPPEFFVAGSEDVPLGAFVAQLSSQTTLGVLNGPCLPTGLTPSFNLLNATTDVNGPQVQYYDDADVGTLGEIFEDDDGDGLPNGVEMYPDFLDRTFAGAVPYARYYGQTNIVGVAVALNFVVFEPGQVLATSDGTFEADESMGYPTVFIIDNAGDPEAVALSSPITDFCTPLKATVYTFGTTQDNPVTGSGGGVTFRRNPLADTTVNFVQWATSQRDADGDGFENGFDTCPFHVNQENPRLGGDAGDPDNDGIDSACDPDPGAICYPGATGAATDCDNDQYPNRGDNCPLIAQALQFDGDNDDIGDACDNNPSTPNGQVTAVCIVNTINIGAGDGDVPDSDDYLCTEDSACIDANSDGECDGGDSDGDGIIDSLDNCPEAFNPNQEDADGDGVGDACEPDDDNDTVLDDADNCPTAPNPGQEDTDGDGLGDACDPDIDDDGIENGADGCPTRAEDPDEFQDTDGCPEADNDLDGVCDPWAEPALPVCTGSDGCPNLPEDFDAFHDTDGCAEYDNDEDGFPDAIDDCPGTDYTAGPDGIADSGDEPLDPLGVPIQTREDYDGVLDNDGCHDSFGDDYDEDGLSDEDEALVYGTDPADPDTDADGFMDGAEQSMGTSPLDACATTPDADDEEPDAWPPDADDDQDADIGDLLRLFQATIGSQGGSFPRSDMDADGDVDVGDVIIAYSDAIMTTCAQGGAP